MTTKVAREMLLAGATTIELETRGFLPVAAFAEIIHKGLLPHAPDQDLGGFFPVSATLDSGGVPTEATSTNAQFVTGAIAVYPDRAVFAWVKGMILPKVGSFAFSLDRVSKTTAISLGGVPGTDVALSDDRTITLIFGGDGIDENLKTGWSIELEQLLNRQPANIHGGAA